MRWVRLAALVVLVACAAIGGQALLGAGAFEAGHVRQALAGLGAWAPVAFIGLNVAFNLMTLPSAAMTLLAGLLFGPVWGWVFNVIGATLGATIAFAIARGLGREAVEARLGGRLRDLDARLGRHGFPCMIFLRLVPVLPFNYVSYGAGVTGVSLVAFVAGTALGLAPLALLYAYFGAAAGKALGL